MKKTKGRCKRNIHNMLPTIAKIRSFKLIMKLSPSNKYRYNKIRDNKLQHHILKSDKGKPLKFIEL